MLYRKKYFWVPPPYRCDPKHPGCGFRPACVPEHLARDVRVRDLRVAGDHRLQHAGLFGVRLSPREAGTIVSRVGVESVFVAADYDCKAKR